MSRIDALYREVVLEHYRHPRGREPLDRSDAQAVVDNPVCGDQVKVELSLESDRISGVSARARGCAIAVAAASVMTELVAGLSRGECDELAAGLEKLLTGGGGAAPLDERLAAFERVAELPSRRRCALLPWEALREVWDQLG